MMIGFLDCLKRERDISIKGMSSDGKMAFRRYPPLTSLNTYTNVSLFLSAASCVLSEEKILQFNDKMEKWQVNLPGKGDAGSSINSSRSAEAKVVNKRETGLSINFVPFKIFPAFIIDLISLDSHAITLKK